MIHNYFDKQPSVQCLACRSIEHLVPNGMGHYQCEKHRGGFSAARWCPTKQYRYNNHGRLIEVWPTIIAGNSTTYTVRLRGTFGGYDLLGFTS